MVRPGIDVRYGKSVQPRRSSNMSVQSPGWLATAGKEEQARLCIWTVKRADTQALLTILSLIQSGAYNS
ncbi:hypothetical protein HID58_091938 [Brassica napus]|uniref:Uncharacterized protein n=1 Tax=Brassica napus TaxID=3708 RepID=A0ABQ7X088_BRANA|nr:hypothetical protein HID58_091938 [Brassica napus]